MARQGIVGGKNGTKGKNFGGTPRMDPFLKGKDKGKGKGKNEGKGKGKNESKGKGKGSGKGK